jgi:DNA polymerase-4
VFVAREGAILHADLDAFYASVELLRDPALAGKPVMVGGTSNRGVVTSASYEARRYGVASGMPTSRARRLCPGGIFLPPDFDAYGSYSRQVRDVFGTFSPVVEPLSLDEAFLDVARARRLWSDPPTLAEALRDRVRRETGLAVSVGVAPNKLVAKLASRQAKPDGIVVVRPGEITEFLAPLPVGALWGVGEQTAAVLERLGLRTIGDVARIPPQTLEEAVKPLGATIARLAAGRDERPVVPDGQRKSMGAEETFEHDLIEEIQICHAVLKLADRVASRLRAQGISGQTVTLKVRFANFQTITRAVTLPNEVDDAPAIYANASKLLFRVMRKEPPGRIRIRLLGVSISHLREWPASEQLTFLRQPRWTDAERAIDRIRLRFGDGAVGFAPLIDD